MKSNAGLSPSMTLKQFDNGYWYATELKAFANRIGVPAANKLRKDELEKAIKAFLKSGSVKRPARRNLSTSGIRDVDRGLRLNLRVRVYTSNKATKGFLEREAQILAPGLKRKPGARYRLNRWREAQLVKGRPITYRDLVREYVRLNQSQGRFARIPHTRYINFLSDFLAAERGATTRDAIKVWKELKRLDAPKDYRSWVKFR